MGTPRTCRGGGFPTHFAFLCRSQCWRTQVQKGLSDGPGQPTSCEQVGEWRPTAFHRLCARTRSRGSKGRGRATLTRDPGTQPVLRRNLLNNQTERKQGGREGGRDRKQEEKVGEGKKSSIHGPGLDSAALTLSALPDLSEPHQHQSSGMAPESAHVHFLGCSPCPRAEARSGSSRHRHGSLLAWEGKGFP